MQKALLLDPKKTYEDVVKSILRRARISVATETDVTKFADRVSRTAPDFILLDITMPGDALSLLTAIRERQPSIPVLLLTTFAGKHQTSLSDLELLDFVRLPLREEELRWRTLHLLESAGNTPQDQSVSGTSAPQAMRHLVPEIHNPSTGRIDAKKVAALLGVPLAETARILGRNLSTVHKTPGAQALQPRLAKLEQILAALHRLAGSNENLRIWLKAPNPELDGRTPIDLLNDGKMEVVAGLLEDALLGQPG